VGRNPDFEDAWYYVKTPNGGEPRISLTTAGPTGVFDVIPTIIP
jgi:hypothetical protein